MKKIFALVLALAMVAMMGACTTGKTETPANDANDANNANDTKKNDDGVVDAEIVD